MKIDLSTGKIEIDQMDILMLGALAIIVNSNKKQKKRVHRLSRKRNK